MLLYCFAAVVRVVAGEEKGCDLPNLFAVQVVRKEFERKKRMLVRGLLVQVVVAFFSFVLFGFCSVSEYILFFLGIERKLRDDCLRITYISCRKIYSL